MTKKKQETKIIKEDIIDVDYSEEMQKSYLNYALEVIEERAIANIKDGLKPVQRRIIYDMLDLGIFYDKAYKKAGRIVGDTMGRICPL